MGDVFAAFIPINGLVSCHWLLDLYVGIRSPGS